MKGPLKVGNPITSKVDKFEMWVGFIFLFFYLSNMIGAENKDPRMYV